MTKIVDMTAVELSKLNSATKYPAIPTYHALVGRGHLTEERQADFSGQDVEVTEKIDGTNCRIILPPHSLPVIGSRTELLHYLSDVIHNPSQGIVDAVRDIARNLASCHSRLGDQYLVLYGEVYGGKTTAGAKNYSTAGVTGFRLFDIANIPDEVLAWDRERIAGWRDGGGQSFMHASELVEITNECGVETVPRVYVQAPPCSVADTYDWLGKSIPNSLATLDNTGKGLPEGIVVRSLDRSQIVKIRFEDYESTIRANLKGQGSSLRGTSRVR